MVIDDERMNEQMEGCVDEWRVFLTTAVDLKASREAAGFICFSDMPVQAITPEKTNSINLITRFSPFSVSLRDREWAE